MSFTIKDLSKLDTAFLASFDPFVEYNCDDDSVDLSVLPGDLEECQDEVRLLYRLQAQGILRRQSTSSEEERLMMYNCMSGEGLDNLKNAVKFNSHNKVDFSWTVDDFTKLTTTDQILSVLHDNVVDLDSLKLTVETELAFSRARLAQLTHVQKGLMEIEQNKLRETYVLEMEKEKEKRDVAAASTPIEVV